MQLLPKTRDALVVGQLLVIECDAKSPYNALSYMWGDPKAKTVIEIDENKQFLVTRNAESALCDLRNEQQALMI